MSFTSERFWKLKKEPMFKGRIVSASMDPIIKVGDEIIVSIGEENIHRFDIVVFYNGHDRLICHVLWRINKIVQPRLFQTRALKGSYDVPLPEELYLGKVLNFRLSWWWKLKLLLK